MWEQFFFIHLTHFNWGSAEIRYAVCQEIQMLISHLSVTELWVQSHLISCETFKLWPMFVVSWANNLSIIALYSSVTTLCGV